MKREIDKREIDKEKERRKEKKRERERKGEREKKRLRLSVSRYRISYQWKIFSSAKFNKT